MSSSQIRRTSHNGDRLFTVLLWAVLAVANLVGGTARAQEDNVEEYYEGDILVSNTYAYYTVSGDSLQALMDDMAANGPQGFWALTQWYVTWSADCELRVDSTITMPELSDDADLYEEEYAEWDRMIAALEEHELGHVANGVGFAQDVLDQGCDVDVDSALAPWTQADIDYDAETQHGVLNGATLYVQ